MLSAPIRDTYRQGLAGLPTRPVQTALFSRGAPEGFLWHRRGSYRPERRHLLQRTRTWGPSPQQRVLTWLRDHVDPQIPRRYYQAVLGHDLHVSVYAALYARHWHAREGWLEDVGRVSQGKVTTAFRDFEALNLVTDSTLYGDFKFHEVGLSATAEANTQTALITPSTIARVAGTQTNPTSSTYQTIATITATATQAWQEHGIFNAATLGTMLDRSLISPIISVVSGDLVEMTYILTKAAEA